MPQETRDLEYLETLIDQHGIRGVLLMLADVCVVKADHVGTNWQDRGLAGLWRGVNRSILGIVNHAGVRLLATTEGRKKDVRS